jgi:membrane-associated phospholipid phosphatase
MKHKIKWIPVGLLISTSAFAGDHTAWTRTADALAVGLPVLAYGVAGSGQADAEGLKELTLGLVSTVAASEVLKRAIPVTRPDGSDTKSFPSRHTAVAFAAARFLDQRYGQDMTSYRPWLYAAAAMTGVASVQAQRHRWGDVIAGGALGYGLAHWSTSPKPGSSRTASTHWDVAPQPGGWAVSWQQHW